MKRTILLAVSTVLLMVASVSAQEEGEKTETKWFDMEQCAVCKHMAQHKDMMQEVKWENHSIPNGMLSVTVIPENLKAPFNKAMASMEKTIAEMKAGKQMKCCGFCQSMGKLDGAGAKTIKIKTALGEITLVTSDDPKVVQAIHTHAKKTNEAHKQMMKQMQKTSTSS